MESDALLSVKDVLRRLGVSRTTLHRMRQTGEFPEPIHVRGRRLWRPDDVQGYIEQQTALRGSHS